MKRRVISFRKFSLAWLLPAVAGCIVQCLISGCNIAGPTFISQGRLSYAEAINRTEDQQILLTIVKGRYQETATLLAVSNVAANMRFQASADAEVGLGDKDNYLGNLVPFSAGVAYEENPTITYHPIKGEDYFEQLMSPIPLDILLVSLRSETQGSALITFLVNRINNLKNPDFFKTEPNESNLRFKRFTELLDELNGLGLMELVESPQADDDLNLLISDYAPAYSELVTEFLDLLDLPASMNDSQDIVIPIVFAVKPKEPQRMGIVTRSLYDMFEIMRASIVVPQEHADADLARAYPPMGYAGEELKILSSKTKPNDMSLAVRYRGYWYYIDEADRNTKAFFVLMRALWSFTSTASEHQSRAPVLTIPVSR